MIVWIGIASGPAILLGAYLVARWAYPRVAHDPDWVIDPITPESVGIVDGVVPEIDPNSWSWWRNPHTKIPLTS